MIYFIIFIFITPSLSQYQQFIGSGLRPDVTFGDHNDRFDISKFLRQQQKVNYKNEILDAQSEEFRRRASGKKNDRSIKINDHKTKKNNDETDTKSLIELLKTGKGNKKMRKKIVRKVEDHVNELANSIILKMRSLRRNFDDDFAYHDNMNSDGGNVEDYITNLKKFDVGLQDLREDDMKISSRRLQDIVDELHGSKPIRRVMVDPEKEILLHYAFPLDVKIKGFLQPSPDAL
ncbi:unnamed protein product [Euphydryas editha]|uniref:Uncharacterized protein n=1 Tax=Euphydryas editha TaxID=104508 RepID=A0AAU9UEC3_EUPED|nr:unnamed protein product [Euphydryas editha]